MKYYCLSFFLITPTLLFSQVKNYDECKLDFLFIELEHRAIFGRDSTEIQKYFDSIFYIASYKLTGRILINVHIDSLGVPCCNSIVKYKQETIDFDELKGIINSMPKWNPGIQNGFKVNSTLNILLALVNKKLKATIIYPEIKRE